MSITNEFQAKSHGSILFVLSLWRKWGVDLDLGFRSMQTSTCHSNLYEDINTMWYLSHTEPVVELNKALRVSNTGWSRHLHGFQMVTLRLLLSTSVPNLTIKSILCIVPLCIVLSQIYLNIGNRLHYHAKIALMLYIQYYNSQSCFGLFSFDLPKLKITKHWNFNI